MDDALYDEATGPTAVDCFPFSRYDLRDEYGLVDEEDA